MSFWHDCGEEFTVNSQDRNTSSEVQVPSGYHCAFRCARVRVEHDALRNTAVRAFTLYALREVPGRDL